MASALPAETEIETDERPVIYVTGFEPFPPHAVNASQRAVERLRETGIGEELGASLVVEVMKVEYDYVSKVIPKRWKELRPKLVVHVGVSSQVCTLTLEQVSHNCGYNRKDNCNSVPHREVCVQGGEDMLQSEIRMDLVTCAINRDTNLKLSSAKSTDAGSVLVVMRVIKFSRHIMFLASSGFHVLQSPRDGILCFYKLKMVGIEIVSSG